MKHSMKIEIPETIQREIGLNEDTVLEAFFEDGVLHIQECDDWPMEVLDTADFGDDEPGDFQLPTPIADVRCTGCENYCKAHHLCLKGIPAILEMEDY